MRRKFGDERELIWMGPIDTGKTKCMHHPRTAQVGGQCEVDYLLNFAPHRPSIELVLRTESNFQ